MKTSLRASWLVAALTVVAAACSSGGGGAPDDSAPRGESTTGAIPTGTGPLIAESILLESADGLVSLELPPGVVHEGSDVGIDVIDAATVDGLGGATAIGPAYRLRPVGLRLPEPIIATIRLPADGLDDGLPVVVAAVSSDGMVTIEPEGRTSFDAAGDVVHLSPIDRLGSLVLLDAGIRVALEPPRVADLEPGASFDATLSAIAMPALVEPWPQYDLEARWGAAGAVSEDSAGAITAVSGLGAGGSGDDWVMTQRFTCEEVGAGTHTVEVRVDADGLTGGGTTRQFLRLDGDSTCGDVGR